MLDEARSVAFYRRAFGLEIINRYDIADFVLVYLASAATPFELELLGDGYGHLALSVTRSRCWSAAAGSPDPPRSALQMFVDCCPGKAELSGGQGDIGAHKTMRGLDLLAEPAIERRAAAGWAGALRWI